MSEPDLSQPRRIHIVGLGGAGMSAIAEILVGTGHTVSGSDLTQSERIDRLVKVGVRAAIGHAGENVGDAEIVACSTAIRPDNPEVVAAIDAGIPVLRRAELLTAITRANQTISVAGTHGKTTTSAMLTVALQGAGFDPSYIVGGEVRDLGRGAAVGSGPNLVVEADESDGTFAELDSHAVVVTNIEPDHLEFYGGFEPLVAAFDRFVLAAPGPAVVCMDDSGVRAMVERVDREFVTYGQADGADYQIVSTQVDPDPANMGAVVVSVSGPTGAHDLVVNQAGMHNVTNAVAAFAMSVSLGADAAAVAKALSGFGGVGRRFEHRGTVDGIVLIDDYAHLATEVEAALSGAASLEPSRLVAVFQPHRYSRTQDLWNTFTMSFALADLLVVTGIYSSGEDPREGISGELIANDVRGNNPAADVRFIESLSDVTAFLVSELRSGDLCLTLGAGDLTNIADDVLAGLGRR
jgi:UDP-N-acetylmuramate--alanine ligase